jgi:hypothetical protein
MTASFTGKPAMPSVLKVDNGNLYLSVFETAYGESMASACIKVNSLRWVVPNPRRVGTSIVGYGYEDATDDPAPKKVFSIFTPYQSDEIVSVVRESGEPSLICGEVGQRG